MVENVFYKLLLLHVIGLICRNIERRRQTFVSYWKNDILQEIFFFLKVMI